MYGYDYVEVFIGIVLQYGGGSVILVNVLFVISIMSVIDWQLGIDVYVVLYGFLMGGEFFVILDDKGFVILLEVYVEDGDIYWEFVYKIDVVSVSVVNLMDDQLFSMVVL